VCKMSLRRLYGESDTRSIWHLTCSRNGQLRSVAALEGRRTTHPLDGDLGSPLATYADHTVWKLVFAPRPVRAQQHPLTRAAIGERSRPALGCAPGALRCDVKQFAQRKFDVARPPSRSIVARRQRDEGRRRFRRLPINAATRVSADPPRVCLRVRHDRHRTHRRKISIKPDQAHSHERSCVPFELSLDASKGWL
jgi:hypothetical protein